jgi:hypothetical protein
MRWFCLSPIRALQEITPLRESPVFPPGRVISCPNDIACVIAWDKRVLPVEHSDAYSIIKALIEQRLLIIRRQELVAWLGRLEAGAQITEEESKDLLRFADALRIFDFLNYE